MYRDRSGPQDAGNDSPRWNLMHQLPLALALSLYFALACFTVGNVGVVGEVAAGWKAGPPPMVAVSLSSEPTWSGPYAQPNAGSSLGFLKASQTRPMEYLRLGPFHVPLALNSYTGAIADWPARLLHAATGSWRLVMALHLLLGAGLIGLVHRFALTWAGPRAAGLASMLLASDWSFVYYRKVLSGIELALQLGLILFLWGLWKHRQGGRSRSLVAAGLGIGLMAKITFLPVLLASLLALVLVRPGKGGRRSRHPRAGMKRLVLGVGLLLLPLLVSLLHHQLFLAGDLEVRSHDNLSLQWSRVLDGLGSMVGGKAPAREDIFNLLYFLGEPLDWFVPALGAEVVPRWGLALRLLGWSFVLLGLAVAWRPRSEGADGRDALLRFLSVALPLQLLFLFACNRDIHHLGQVSPVLALLGGLALERCSSVQAASSVRRCSLGVVLALPLVLAGVSSLVRTDGVLQGITAPTFSRQGQASLVQMLREQGVRELWTSDYDLYGVFEVLMPRLKVRHAWGAVSTGRRRDDLTLGILRAARGGHWLIVRPTAPMIYNLHPSTSRVVSLAADIGMQVREVARLQDERGTWARLLEVGADGNRSQ